MKFGRQDFQRAWAGLTGWLRRVLAAVGAALAGVFARLKDSRAAAALQARLGGGRAPAEEKHLDGVAQAAVDFLAAPKTPPARRRRELHRPSLAGLREAGRAAVRGAGGPGAAAPGHGVRRRILAGFLLLTAVNLVIVGFGMYTQGRAVRASQTVADVNDIIRQAERTQAGLNAMDAGSMAYVLTADPAFLMQYDRGRAEYRAGLETLSTLLAGQRDVAGELDGIARQVDDWDQQYVWKAIEMRREAQAGAYTLEQLAGEHVAAGGRNIFDGVTARLTIVIEKETSRLQQANADMAGAAGLARRVLMFGALVSAAFGLLYGLAAAESIARPLQQIALAAAQLGLGNLKAGANAEGRRRLLERGDEVGQVGRGLIEIEAYLGEMAELAERIAHGDLTVEITPRSEQDELGHTLRYMVTGLRRLVSEVNESAQALAGASTQVSLSAGGTGDAVEQIAATLQQISQGAMQQAGAVGAAGDSMEAMAEAIHSVAAGAREQTSAVEQAARAAGEISTAITSVAQNAATSAGSATGAAEAARAGAQTVSAVMKSMEDIRTQALNSAEKVAEMSRRSEQVGDIIETIQDIASQTNLLALNAAIEAAHAGEHGRGFAVVADEVRKLADRAAVSAKEIAGLIKGIQKTAAEAAAAMDVSRREVARGAEHASRSGKALENILAAVDGLRAQVNEIASAAAQAAAAAGRLDNAMGGVSSVAGRNATVAREMDAGSGRVNRAVADIAAISEENSAALEQVSAGAEEMSAQVQDVAEAAQALDDLAARLLQAIAVFRLEGGPRDDGRPGGGPAAGAGPDEPPRLRYLGPERRKAPEPSKN